MNIVILNKYQFSVNRGAETFVFELTKRLSVKHKVNILSKINYFDLIKRDFDVIIPTNGREQVFLARIIAWIKGAKMIVSGQSGAGLDDRINLYAFPDAFVGLSSYQSKWARQVNPFIKVETIPNGVDLTIFKETKIKPKEKLVLGVGAFTNEKRHELTIKALEEIPNIKLMIVGSGGDKKEEIEQLGKKVLGERFSIISVAHEKMPEIYKKASLLVFPTVPWESFGIVMVEAMASGLPVIATDDPIRREIIGDAGAVVNPNDIEKYSKAIKETLDKKWGNKPRKQAELFSWDKIAIQYNNLIESLVNK